MNFLAFDTATEQTRAALCVGETVSVADAPGGAKASATLIPMLLGLLARAGIGLGDLDAIAFGRGPGAFTGLRTACSVAQGLAYGAGKPVLPIDTLLAIAEAARAETVRDDVKAFRVWAVLDARMNEIYAARYAFGPDTGWQVLDAPFLTHPEALNARWAADPPAAVAGNALAVFGAALRPGAAMLQPDAAPTAVALLTLAHAAWQRGEAVAPAQALPLYLRDKVAQTTVEREAARAAKAPVGESASAGARR